MPSPVLPPELSDLIISYLHHDDDMPTLCRCSLVCRSWFPPSRLQLFRQFFIVPWKLDTTLTMLCDKASTIPPYVRHLYIEDWGNQAIDLNDVLPKLSVLNGLMGLALSRFTWTGVTLHVRNGLPALLRNLKTLDLSFITFDGLDQALELISLMPSLEDLLLGSVTYKNECTSLTQVTAPPLKRIQFESSNYIASIIDWLCIWQPAPNVQTVFFDEINIDNTPIICSYLQVLGSTLEHLRLDYPSFDTTGEIRAVLSNRIDLALNISLRTITFDAFVLYSNSPELHSCDWVIDILFQITSPYIERVTLIIFLNTVQELVALDVLALVKLFSGPGGHKLFAERSTKLCFTIFGNVSRADAIRTITESFHDLNLQGRLEFVERRMSLHYQ